MFIKPSKPLKRLFFSSHIIQSQAAGKMPRTDFDDLQPQLPQNLQNAFLLYLWVYLACMHRMIHSQICLPDKFLCFSFGFLGVSRLKHECLLHFRLGNVQHAFSKSLQSIALKIFKVMRPDTVRRTLGMTNDQQQQTSTNAFFSDSMLYGEITYVIPTDICSIPNQHWAATNDVHSHKY